MQPSNTVASPSLLCVAARGLIPWRLRRMIFLSTLYGSIAKREGLDVQHIQQLNKMLNLSGNTSKTGVPIIIRAAAWIRKGSKLYYVGDQQYNLTDIVRSDLDEKTRTDLLHEVVEHMPAWVKYAKTKNIVYDIEKLIKAVQSMSVQLVAS